MRPLFFLLGLVACVSAPSVCRAQTESLAFLVSHSDSVVVATCTHSGRAYADGFTARATDDFDVVSVLAGKPTQKNIGVVFFRDREEPDRPFKLGQRVILFLRHARTTSPEWELADRVLGCQDATRSLEAAVGESIPKSP